MTPKTKLEAESCRYGSWAGKPAGNRYDPEYCAEAVWTGGRASMERQCCKKSGYGPDGLFCKQHDPATKAVRAQKSEEKYQAQQRAERPRWYAKPMLELLIESQTSIGGDWRQRRDELIKTITE